MLERFFPKQKAAAFSAHDVTSVEYAQGHASRVVQLRTFEASVLRLTPKELELTYRRSGIIFKGVNRKARDAIKKGFVLAPDSEDREEQAELNAAARAWMRRTSFKAKTIRALREMYVFGDGFLELAFPGTAAATSPAPKNGEPQRVFNVDPFSMRPVKDLTTGEIVWYLNGENVRDIPREDIRAWLQGRRALPQGIKQIHPSRIVHFQVNSIRDDPDGLGISVIEAAYVNALAKLAGDRAAGDILEWYAKGFFVLNIEYATEEELKEAEKKLASAKEARKNYFVGSERSTFDIKSPLVANVKPFYDAFYIELAAALEMPTLMAVGVQKGTVTGSEVDVQDYNDDNLSLQELLLEPPIYDLMRRVVRREDFTIKWVPLFADKQTEADIRFKDSQSAAQLFGSGILTRRQAIRFLTTGDLPSPDDVPDDYTQANTPGAPPSPDSGEPPASPGSGEDSEDREREDESLLPDAAPGVRLG